MNVHNSIQDDPMLTAYALGELDAAASAVIESQLQHDAGLRETVEQIRHTATLLKSEFAAEVSPGLTSEQLDRIHHHAEPAPIPILLRARTIWWGVGAAAAACLTITAFVTWPTQPRDEFVHVSVDPSGPDAMRRELDERVAGGLGLGEEGVAASGGFGGGIGSRESASDTVSSMKERVETRLGKELEVASGPDRGAEVGESSEGGSFVSGNGAAKSIGAAAPSAFSSPPSASPSTNETANRPRLSVGPDSVALRRTNRDDVAQVPGRTRTAASGSPAINDEREAATEFLPADQPSTFGIDVDTASYANIRNWINDGALPPRDAIRIEELINYFPYNYEPPSGVAPFSANFEVSAAPWNPDNRLLRIGLRGKDIKPGMRPPTSLVFLIDTSGSMNQPKKLPLVQDALKLLVNQLNADDRLAIVTYSGEAGVIQESVFCTPVNREAIAKKIDALTAGGSTNGAGGIGVAYELATQGYIKGGVNRVILCTDGDFNVGASTESELIELIHQKRATGVYLSVLGFGTGNWQDAKMKQLVLHGNGNFAYIDSTNEARKVLIDQMSGTLVTIAKDVKVQVQFNPAVVKEYRLIGYENRVMDAADFTNDRVDAGEIGAGHTMTALYEVVPKADREVEVQDDSFATLRLRYKQPDGEESEPLEFAIADAGQTFEDASPDFKFASAVAAFGMALQNPADKKNDALPMILELAQTAADEAEGSMHGSRAEFLYLVRAAKALIDSQPQPETRPE